MKNPPVIHPFLFAVSPVVFLYMHNIGTLPIALGELVLPLALALALAAICWLVWALLVRDRLKAGVIASVLLVLFFLYGHVLSSLGPRRVSPGLVSVLWLVLFAGSAVLIARSRHSLRGVTVALNAIAAAVLLTNLLAGLPSFRAAGPGLRPSNDRHETPAARSSSQPPARYPDIYYIVLDGFARPDVLEQQYGVDASQFVDFLTGQGFYVIPRSRSNYSQTYLSLASVLNCSYLDSLLTGSGPGDQSRVPLTRLIQNNRVTRFLKARGYSTVAFASSYAGTELRKSDVFLEPRWALSEFQNILLSTTPLPLLLGLLVRKTQWDLHRERICYTLSNLPASSRGRHPAFIFAHILTPHAPFVFGAHGEKKNPPGVFTITEGGDFRVVDKQRIRQDYISGYQGQITFLMTKVQEMVTRVLAESSNPPVIVLQGDHGPGSILNWDDPDWRELPERFANLNAIRVPECAVRNPSAPALYDSMTAVNTFPVLLNRLFDTTFALQPDRSYFSTTAQPFDFYDLADPSAYRAAHRSAEEGAVTVVVFPNAAQASDDPASYARRIVNLRYPGEKRAISRFYIKPVSEDLTVDQSVDLYRQSVASGAIPDLGATYDSYQGPGPAQELVSALFFLQPARP